MRVLRMKSNAILVTEIGEGMRLDKYLALQNEDYSRSFIQVLIKEGKAKINGRTVKASYKLKKNEKIEIEIPTFQKIGLLAQALDLNIVHEDEQIIVINKQAGLVVHPAPAYPDGTLANGLVYRYEELRTLNHGLRPGIVHRLDRDTSGLIVVARTKEAYDKLKNDFKTRQVKKIYHCLVRGELAYDHGEIKSNIGRHPWQRQKMAAETIGGRPALTSYKLIRKTEKISYLEIDLHTGRTHQIRVHMASLGYPIIGDSVYGDRHSSALAPRQMLHSHQLAFSHPGTGEKVSFLAPLPDDFLVTMNSFGF